MIEERTQTAKKMAKNAPKFSGFPEPKTNFTGIPNIFFDEIMPFLKEGALKVMLYIFRHTYGWQKDVDCISISQFVNGIVTKRGKRLDYGTGLGTSTVKEAITALIQGGYILRFIHGKGRARKSFFFLHTVKNRQIVTRLESGQLTLGDIGLNSGPMNGPKSGPKTSGQNGPKSGYTKQSSTKEKVQKKGFPPIQNSKKQNPESDAVERLREQHITRQRRAENATDQPTHISNLLSGMNLSSPETEI